MVKRCPTVLCTFLLLCLLALSSCSQSSQTVTPTQTPTKPPVIATSTTPPTVSPTATGTPGVTPQHFKTRVILSGKRRPDDLVFDPQGRLVFSDFYSGAISRL